jgi:hypothetical protein
VTPIDQTKTLEEGLRGNCLAASVASLFDVSLSDVPSFEEMSDSDWKPALEGWALGFGRKLVKKRPGDFTVDEHYIAIGLSDRGNKHATVGLNGRIVHDPHFMRLGLAQVVCLYTFEPV